MSGRRKGGAGQSGQLCRGGTAREAANCSGKPGAPPAGRAPGKRKAQTVLCRFNRSHPQREGEAKIKLKRSKTTGTLFPNGTKVQYGDFPVSRLSSLPAVSVLR